MMRFLEKVGAGHPRSPGQESDRQNRSTGAKKKVSPAKGARKDGSTKAATRKTGGKETSASRSAKPGTGRRDSSEGSEAAISARSTESTEEVEILFNEERNAERDVDDLIAGLRKDFEGTEMSGRLVGVPISVKVEKGFQVGSSSDPAEGVASSHAIGQTGKNLTQTESPGGKDALSASGEKGSKSSGGSGQKSQKEAEQRTPCAVRTPAPVEVPELQLLPALDACAESDSETQLKGLRSLRILSRGHKLARMDMVNAGTVETVLQMQGCAAAREDMLNLMLLVLLNLTFDDENIGELDVIIPFAETSLSHPSIEVVESAAAIVFSLSRQDFHRESLLKPSVVEPLVKILASGTEQGKRDSCKALFHLSYLPQSYALLLEKGVVDPAVQLLSPPDSKIAEKATCLLANIARCPEGCAAIAESDDGLSSLVEMLEVGSHLAKEFAAAALLLIAQADSSHRDSLILESPFIALNGLQNTGTARAKLKACALLSLLRNGKEGGEANDV